MSWREWLDMCGMPQSKMTNGGAGVTAHPIVGIIRVDAERNGPHP